MSTAKPDATTLLRVAVPFDEQRLVERARTDADAFAELYRSHAHRVHALAWRRLGSRDAAEEVTSATFERAWRALPGFEWRDGGFPAWLLRIAANQVTDHLRRESRPRSPRGQRALSLLAPATTVGTEDVFGADDPALRAALGRLRPRYAEALTLRYLADLTATEAAAALDCTPATFAVVLHRAHAALRRELPREDHHDRT
ncbi:MAG: putative polymerase sigma-H factor [Actinomycetia bacterium]|nr:putative polymerase sigma-H factor [Actinomycetes bacterium]